MQLVIDYKDSDDLRMKLNEQKKALIGTRNFDVFKHVSITNEDIININENYFTEQDMIEDFEIVYAPLRFIYQDKPILTNKGSRVVVSPTSVHDSLRNLTLNVFGATQNKQLENQQLEEAKEIYSAFKDLYLKFYNQRFCGEEGKNNVLSNNNM